MNFHYLWYINNVNVERNTLRVGKAQYNPVSIATHVLLHNLVRHTDMAACVVQGFEPHQGLRCPSSQLGEHIRPPLDVSPFFVIP